MFCLRVTLAEYHCENTVYLIQRVFTFSNITLKRQMTIYVKRTPICWNKTTSTCFRSIY